MILYACPTCGIWQDVSLAKELTKAWNNTVKSAQIPEDRGWPCPAGHGLMRHVASTDRIFVRPASVESIVEIGEGDKP